MNFTEFSLHEAVQGGIADAGYVTCTPVQEQVLHHSLEGRDLYVQSQTGTGKTAAYLVSVLQELMHRGEAAGKKALVMVPTHELAVQVQEEAQKLAKHTSLTCGAFYGGVGYDKQVAALKKGVDIIIGTPGRVIDLQEGNQMDLSNVGFLVIDEADRMFDMGFYPELRRLIKVLPPAEKRQTMLFSATLNSYVKNLAWEYTRNPAEITIDAEHITVDEIDQLLLHVSSDNKMKLLVGIIQAEKPESLIVFCNTKRGCEVVAKRLRMNGIQSEYIIGDLPQSKRSSIMNDFKAGKVRCLVATDVAARGIDVNDLAMVINYDLPNEAENYVHRIGRTARAGKSGKAYTFCSEQDVYSLPPIERYVGKTIPAQVAETSQMAEDKSSGVYIRTENYHEGYSDRSDFGRRRAAEYERKGRRSRGGHESGGSRKDRGGSPRGKGRYSSRNEEAAREYRRDRRVFSAEEEAQLATMSTDERMKLYRERFAGSSFGTEKAAQPPQFPGGTKKNGGKKTRRQRAGKKASLTEKQHDGNAKSGKKAPDDKKGQAAKQQGDRPQERPQKKGFLGALKSLFTGKK